MLYTNLRNTMDPIYLETAVQLVCGLNDEEELILLASAEHMVQTAVRNMTSTPLGKPPKLESILAYNRKWIKPHERLSKLENLLRLHTEVMIQNEKHFT